MATMATTKRPSLGRGLGALLGQPEPRRRAAVVHGAALRRELQKLPVDLLQRGKYQPRIDMRQETLQELADSIKAQGVIQPIVVRRWAAPRRARPRSATRSSPASAAGAPRSWRACTRFPAVVRRVDDEPRSRWR